MRVLVLSMQATGASSFAFFLGQREDSVVVWDNYNLKQPLNTPNCKNVILKQNLYPCDPVSVSEKIEVFKPDRTILFVRDPRDIWTSLDKTSEGIGGTIKEKLVMINELVESGRFIILRYEDFILNRENFVQSLQLLFPDLGITMDNYKLNRTCESLISCNASAGLIFGEDYGLGNIRKEDKWNPISTEIIGRAIPSTINNWIVIRCQAWMEAYTDKAVNVFDGDHEAKKYTFHQLGLVHLPPSQEYTSCAYTQKIRKLTRMLLSKGHRVFLYGTGECDIEHPNFTFVQCATMEELRAQWGDPGNNEGLGYNWRQEQFRQDLNGGPSPLGKTFIERAKQAIRKTIKGDHFLLCTQGSYHQSISEEFQLFLTVEPGVGYSGTVNRLAAFESNFLRSYIAGARCGGNSSDDGDFYQRVIPNYFDLDEFPFVEKPKGDYFIFMGRVIHRKGWHIAKDVAKAFGIKIKIVGQCDKDLPDGIKNEPLVEYIPSVGSKERAELLGNALVTFVPTLYYEPFGGVSIESMLCGTPVVTTDFGVFPETIVPGVSGYRANNFSDFVNMTMEAMKLDRKVVRKFADSRYSMEVVNESFEEWWRVLYKTYIGHMMGVNEWWALDSATRWKIAQSREEAWNKDEKNRKDRIEMAEVFLGGLGIRHDYFDLNLDGKSVLDVGGGTTSILMKCKNFNGAVLDPILAVAKSHYSGIRRLPFRYEDTNEGDWDEVWAYDFLAHVEDPHRCAGFLKGAGKTIRIMEWINVEKSPQNLTMFSALDLKLLFGQDGKVVTTSDGRKAWVCTIINK